MMIEQQLRSDAVRREVRGRAQIRRLMAKVVEHDDVLVGLEKGQADLLQLLKADGALVSLDSRMVLLGATPSQEWAQAFVSWLDAAGEGQFQSDALHKIYAGDGLVDPRAAGVMAQAFHASRAGYVVAFRSELVREISWASNPHQPATVGPHGDRLTPRGSFEMWKEQIAGSSKPWHPTSQALLEDLCQELTQMVLRWTSEEGRLRDIMVGMVSHDLRTPLSAITMGAELIGDSEPIASRITSSSQRMSHLIETLVDFSLLQAGKGIGIHPQLVNVVTLAQRVVDEVSMAYPGGNFVLTAPEAALAEIDPSRIEQVISNLVSNARHHGVSGGVIQTEVTQQPETNDVVVRVHNEGFIPDEFMAKIFSAYKDRAREGVSARKGMGLGLFIVKAIVDAHGGQIEVKSDQQTGTCFAITLPAKSKERPKGDSLPPLPYG